MRFTYCPHCGSLLTRRPIGDEGLIPYCDQCRVPLWDMFTTCVICSVVNEFDEIALLRQNYVSTTSHVLVAGIMKLGERAEEAAVREIREELGQEVETLTFAGSYPYEKKEMLMLAFHARVKKAKLKLSGEVDSAVWVPLHEAPALLRQGSIAWQVVQSLIEKQAF